MPEHCHLCYQQLEENICQVWNPRESCQWQQTTTQQHQTFVKQKPWVQEICWLGIFPYHQLSRVSSIKWRSGKSCTDTKRILKKASAEKKDPFEGLLKCCNTPFKDIGVSPAQLLTSRRIRTMIRTHQSLLAPQPGDRHHVLKTLHHRHHHAKSNYDKQIFASTCGWGQGAVSSKWWEGMAQSGSNAKIIHAGRWISTCLKEKQKTDHHYSKRFSHETKDRDSSHEYTTPWLFCEYKACTCPWEASAKSSDIRERDKPVTHTPITTRSGRQVRRPQKLIEPC